MNARGSVNLISMTCRTGLTHVTEVGHEAFSRLCDGSQHRAFRLFVRSERQPPFDAIAAALRRLGAANTKRDGRGRLADIRCWREARARLVEVVRIGAVERAGGRRLAQQSEPRRGGQKLAGGTRAVAGADWVVDASHRRSRRPGWSPARPYLAGAWSADSRL